MTTQATQNDTGSAIVAVDKICHICSFNEEAERITGLRAADVLGRRFCRAVWSLGCRLDPSVIYCHWRYAIQGQNRRTGPRAWQVTIVSPFGPPDVGPNGERKRLELLVGEEGYTTPEGARGAFITFRENPPRDLRDLLG